MIARDGRISRYHFPEMQDLSFLRRYVKERYRKFAETLPVESNSSAWPDVAQRLARSYWDPANPPEVVMLIKYTTDIALMGTQLPPHAEVFFQTRLQDPAE